MRAKAYISLLTLSVILSIQSNVAMAQTIKIVSPNEFADKEGDDYVGGDCCNPIRYQQVFPATDFEALGGRPHWITQLAFRPDASVRSPQTNTWDDLKITLSTTDAGPDDLSAFFDENVGSNATVVWDGPRSGSTQNLGPATGPKEFDGGYQLHSPFLYNPSQGNLLLDWISRSGGKTVTSTGQPPVAGSDAFRRPPTTALYQQDPDAETGQFFGGLVYQFTFEPAAPLLQPGDANQDLKFDQLDLVEVQIAGKYLTGHVATWGEGDWNGAPGAVLVIHLPVMPDLIKWTLFPQLEEASISPVPTRRSDQVVNKATGRHRSDITPVRAKYGSTRRPAPT